MKPLGAGPQSRAGVAIVARVMTADVAQAVSDLRAAILKVDELDAAVLRGRAKASDLEATQQLRAAARAELRQRRAALDAIQATKADREGAPARTEDGRVAGFVAAEHCAGFP